MMKQVVPTVRQGGVSVALVMVLPFDRIKLMGAQLNTSSHYNRYGTHIQGASGAAGTQCQIPDDLVSLSRAHRRGSRESQEGWHRRYHHQPL